MLQANSEDYEIKFFFVFISQVDLVMDIFNSLFTLQVATSVISLCGGVFVVAFVCYFSDFPGKENNCQTVLHRSNQTLKSITGSMLSHCFTCSWIFSFLCTLGMK